jgi:hypothetical protein
VKLKYRVLEATKAGNQAAEMEDAAAPSQPTVVEAEAFACAVADGATQGSHSGPWARALCDAFIAAPGAALSRLGDVVPAALSAFQAWEKDYLAQRASANRPLQWFEQEVMGSGAYSTLVGVQLDAIASGGAVFAAVAIGDSCLFHVRGGKVTTSFPLTAAAQFSSSPLLVASLPAANQRMGDGISHLKGEMAPGDALLLCTDALAAWILRETEAGRAPVPELLGLLAAEDREAFAAFLGRLRSEKLIRNDDVTLALVALED